MLYQFISQDPVSMFFVIIKIHPLPLQDHLHHCCLDHHHLHLLHLCQKLVGVMEGFQGEELTRHTHWWLYSRPTALTITIRWPWWFLATLVFRIMLAILHNLVDRKVVCFFCNVWLVMESKTLLKMIRGKSGEGLNQNKKITFVMASLRCCSCLLLVLKLRWIL